MTDDIIWALDQRERCIACPSKPLANAIVLHLSADGSLPRDAVGSWAEAGVLAAGIVWPGVDATLTDDDWLDLTDAVRALADLAAVVAVVGHDDAARIATELGERDGDVGYGGPAHRELVLTHLREIAPV